MPECEFCGAFVTEAYVRVFSPDGETVRCCPDDDAIRDGRDVRQKRSVHGASDVTTYQPAGGDD